MNWPSTPASIAKFLRRTGDSQEQQPSRPSPPRTPGKLGDLIRAGDAASRERRWADAEQAYAEALRRNPRLIAMWVQYGHSLKEQGFFGQAEEAYRRALALDERVADTHLQLGHVLKLQNRFDEAIAAYRASYALDEHLEDARRELQALGASDGITVPLTGLFDRNRREPAEFPPDIRTKRADSSDIRALHLLLLGRFPEDWTPFGVHQGRPIVDITRELVQSGEFHRLVLVPLMAGRHTRHEQLGEAELESVKSWLGGFGAEAEAGLSWLELLRQYLSREPLAQIFAQAVLGSFQPMLEALNGRELVGKYFGQEGISIRLLVDGEIASEFTVNGADRPREDISGRVSRFHLMIPVDAFDGRDHDIEVRDGRTQAAVPSGRFTARLVPRFEGLIVGSCTRLTGWVRRTPASDHRVSVEIRDGAQVLCAAIADQTTANPVAGDHGFELDVPANLPGTAAIYLDDFPITSLTDEFAAPVRLAQDSWQIGLGRSDVLVLDESAIEPVPLPLGFSLDSISEGIRRYGHRYVLNGIHDLAARGRNPQTAVSDILRYVAVSKDYVLLRLIRSEWTALLANDPKLLEQAIRLYLNADDLDGAGQLLQAAGNSGRETTVSADLLQAALDSGRRQTESARANMLLDPFAVTSSHRDAINSTYHTLVITVGRQRMLIEKLLNAVEARNTGHTR